MYNHMMTIYGSKLTSVCTNTIHLIGSYIHVMGIKLIKLDSKTQILFVAIKFMWVINNAHAHYNRNKA